MIHIKETHINKDEKCTFGDTDVYETYTDSIGELFKDLQIQFGRCVSSMYVDKKDGATKKIGWVFEKKNKYNDCNKTYMQETWIELHKTKPKKTIEYDLLEMSA